MNNKKNYRIKILLSNHARENKLDDHELLKYTEGDKYYPDSAIIGENTVLFYKKSGQYPPKWYVDYLHQDNQLVTSEHSSGLFFRTINYEGEEYKFAICFSGGENMLDLKHFKIRFGLKLALNVAEKIYTIKKNRISDTQANVKEDAVKGQEITEFDFGINTDLLSGVIVVPKENKIATGNIHGSNFASFTTTYDFNELSDLLKECYEIYSGNQYKENYDFIDDIEEIPNYNPIIEKINDEVLKIYHSDDIGNVWFAPASTERMEYIIDYTFYANRITEKNTARGTRTEIDLESVKSFINEKKININVFKDFEKVKIVVNYDDGKSEQTWNLLECLYASVVVEENQYVINAGRVYKVDSIFYKTKEEQFYDLPIVDSLPPCSSSETAYNKNVFNENETKYLYLDAKITKGRNKVEVCDLYDLEKHTFIHIKKYGASSKLSHVFAQAKVSAESLNSIDLRENMLDVMTTEKPGFELPNTEDLNVVIGIITSKDLEKNGHANLPFFSKVNAVSTLNYIKNNLKFKSASMMYIKQQ